jgi:hypothetical protein
MSVYSELVNESGVNPTALSATLATEILADPPAPWNLPAIDALDLWGAVTLRQMFLLVSGGDTPTTYSRRMADAMRALTDSGPSLLGFEEEPVDADFTRALETIRSLRHDIFDVEVLDG